MTLTEVLDEKEQRTQDLICSDPECSSCQTHREKLALIKALRESQLLYRIAVKGSPDIVAMYDVEIAETLTNPAPSVQESVPVSETSAPSAPTPTQGETALGLKEAK